MTRMPVPSVCFFTEHVDLVLDGVAQPRTVSPWSGRTAGRPDGRTAAMITQPHR